MTSKATAVTESDEPQGSYKIDLASRKLIYMVGSVPHEVQLLHDTNALWSLPMLLYSGETKVFGPNAHLGNFQCEIMPDLNSIQSGLDLLGYPGTVSDKMKKVIEALVHPIAEVMSPEICKHMTGPNYFTVERKATVEGKAYLLKITIW